VRSAVDPLVAATPGLRVAVLDTVADLDAVADARFAQAGFPARIGVARGDGVDACPGYAIDVSSWSLA
jgi:hypothetical protein